jgi:ketosteroid isomerase-like protein
MRRRAFLLGAAIFAMSACTTKSPEADTKTPAAAAPDAAADEAALRAAAPVWFDRYNKGDAQGVADLYADDGVILAPGTAAAVGKDAILAFLQKDIAGTKAAGMSDDNGDITGAGASGDLGWVTGIWYLIDSKGKRVETGKYLTLYRRTATGWQIIRDTWNSDMPPAPPPKA